MKKVILLLFLFLIEKRGFAKDFCLHPESSHIIAPDLLLELPSTAGIIFIIKMIKAATSNCINPKFPVILVETQPKMDAWLQIVYTNSDEEKFQTFIDYDPNFTEKPFYSYSKYFYDAPLWSFDNQSQLEWRGHLFPVKIIDDNIQLITGIEWGFIIKNGQITNVKPRLLTKKEVNKAKKFLSDNLPKKFVILHHE